MPRRGPAELIYLLAVGKIDLLAGAGAAATPATLTLADLICAGGYNVEDNGSGQVSEFFSRASSPLSFSSTTVFLAAPMPLKVSSWVCDCSYELFLFVKDLPMSSGFFTLDTFAVA